MRFAFFVALRYLKAKRRQSVISIITVISVLGVAAGVCALVVALSINNGFREDLEQRLLGATADIDLLHPQDNTIVNYDALANRLVRLPHVVAAAPELYEEVFISHAQKGQGIVLKGVEPEREVKVGDLLQRITSGSLKDLSETFPDADAIIIGSDLADELGARVGSTVEVISPQGYLTPLGPVPKYRNFRVVGIFNSGFYDFDATWAFTNLEAAQRLFDLTSVVSVIGFKIDDVNRAPDVAEAIRQAAGKGYDTTTWIEQNHSLFTALRLERLVTFLTIGLIVLVAALNIFITLAMMVMEKNREIAVMISMGARRGQIWAIFTLHGVMIGTLGTILGLAAGYVGSWAANHYQIFHIPADVYALSYVPFHSRPWDGVWIAALAIGVSFLATIYPSLSATRLAPVETLRYE
ncbi:MAG TPA: ABC transporter permease [Terriglobia bacterium]|nr:ABC transporter permease [Terriglobia bacterium]